MDVQTDRLFLVYSQKHSFCRGIKKKFLLEMFLSPKIDERILLFVLDLHLTHYHTMLHFDTLKIYIVVEKIVRKGEIASYKQCLLFSQCFLPYMAFFSKFKCTLTCLQFVSIWTSLTFCRLVMGWIAGSLNHNAVSRHWWMFIAIVQL